MDTIERIHSIEKDVVELKTIVAHNSKDLGLLMSMQRKVLWAVLVGTMTMLGSVLLLVVKL